MGQRAGKVALVTGAPVGMGRAIAETRWNEGRPNLDAIKTEFA